MLDTDNPWKEVCANKLPLVLALLYRRVYRGLDWGQDYENLDQELRKLAPDLATGKRIADRLIKAFSQTRDKEKSDARYFHLEVQGKKEKGFERRMHIYNFSGGGPLRSAGRQPGHPGGRRPRVAPHALRGRLLSHQTPTHPGPARPGTGSPEAAEVSPALSGGEDLAFPDCETDRFSRPGSGTGSDGKSNGAVRGSPS
jgi:hypothetical protein